MKRLLSLLSLLVILTVVVSACGGGQTEPAAEEEPEATTEETEATEEETEATDEETEAAEEEATEETEATEEETEATDEETEAAGDFEGTIKIATQSPLSGPQAAIGVGVRNGPELALEDMSSTLTDLGFEVELEPFDDEAQPERGTANANNAVADPDIMCVVGHLNSGVSLAALPIYDEASLAMISPSSTNPNITEGGFDVGYRVVGRDDVQGQVAEQFARETLEIESVYIIHDQTDYGQGIAEFFRQFAEENDIEVLGFEGTQETSVFDSILTPIQAADPDLIYFGGIYSQAGPFFRQARDRGITAEFMGPDGMDNSELAELAGDAVEGMYYSSVAAPVSQFPDAADYATAYEETYGESAPPFSAQAYDAAGICIQAIANAAEEVGGLPTREDVVAALDDLEAYEGITGSYEFNDIGDPVEATYFILQVNVDDWNENEVVERLDISAPGEDGEDGEAMEEEATEEATEEVAAEGDTIVDVADAAGSFTTLLAAAEAAELAETLSGEGPFTVFAPTDDAFAALPEGTVEALLEDPDTLSEILLYHVVEGEVLAEDVVELESATTVQGGDVSITVEDDTVLLNDETEVVETDIEASNGVIHVIDSVLLPPDVELPEAGAMDETEMEEEEAAEELEVVGSGETIKIATQSPLSGPQAAIGVGLRNAAELGIEDLGQSLVDQGFEVELEPFDDEAQPERGVANANNAVADSDILCMVGHYNSGVALAALPVYDEASLVMMSPANTNPNITEGGFDVAFRIVGRDDVQGVVGSTFAREQLDAESVYIIHDQTDYGQGIAEVFREDAEENGVEVLGFEGTQETSVFDSILTPIQAADPDVIYFAGIFSQAGPFFRQARDRGITAEFMGPDGLDNAELAELGGSAVADMHYTSVAAPVSQFPEAADFADAYEENYGDPAPPFSAQAYDSTGLCLQAISNAAQEVGGLPTREDVLAAMEELEPYTGITGTYEFNDIGDPVEGVYYVLQANVDDWNANELADRLVIAPPEN